MSSPDHELIPLILNSSSSLSQIPTLSPNTHSSRYSTKHQPVLDVPPTRKPAIHKIVPPWLPRRHIPTHWELLPPHRLLDIRAVQIQYLRLVHLLARLDRRHCAGLPFGLHLLQQPDKQADGSVTAKRPARVRVAKDKGEVGDVLQHSTAPDELIADAKGLAVNAESCVAAELDFQSRSSDDDVDVIERLAVLQLNAFLRDSVNMAGHNVCLATAERSEEVAVGGNAQSLLPGAVGGREMLVDGQLCPDELFLRAGAEEIDGLRREETTVPKEGGGLKEETHANHLIHPAGGQKAADEAIDGVGGGERDMVTG